MTSNSYEDTAGAPNADQMQTAVSELADVLHRHSQTMNEETYDYTIISLLVSIAMGTSAPRAFCLQTALSAMSSLENIEEDGGYMTVQAEEDISATAIPTLHEAIQSAFGTALQDEVDSAAGKGRH